MRNEHNQVIIFFTFTDGGKSYLQRITFYKNTPDLRKNKERKLIPPKKCKRQHRMAIDPFLTCFYLTPLVHHQSSQMAHDMTEAATCLAVPISIFTDARRVERVPWRWLADSKDILIELSDNDST